MKNLKLKLILSFYFCCEFVFSQVDPPADDDPPSAPIDSQVLWMLVLGISIGFIYLNYKRKKNQLQ